MINMAKMTTGALIQCIVPLELEFGESLDRCGHLWLEISFQSWQREENSLLA